MLGILAVLTVEGPCMAAMSEWNVVDFGAKGDASADCTPAFQLALDAAHAANGGVVFAPTGRYRFEGVLNVPEDVTLRGVYAYAPAHAGLRDEDRPKPVYGSVLEPHGGAGSEDGAPFITLQANAVLQGFTVHYPGQDPKGAAPVPYPYTIAMRGNNPAIMDVQLLNPYNAIDASQNQRALIRNIHGQPIHIGIFVDRVYDIGRIEKTSTGTSGGASARPYTNGRPRMAWGLSSGAPIGITCSTRSASATPSATASSKRKTAPATVISSASARTTATPPLSRWSKAPLTASSLPTAS